MKNIISIFGPDEENQNEIPSLYNMIVDLYSSNQNYHLTTIGNGAKGLEEIDEITEVLQSVTIGEKRPLIIMVVHGCTFKVNGYKVHASALFEDANKGSIYTASLVKDISEIIKVPLDLILISCMSAAALRYAHILPKGSTFTSLGTETNSLTMGSIIGMIETLQSLSSNDVTPVDFIKAYLICENGNFKSAPTIAFARYNKEIEMKGFCKQHLGVKLSVEQLKIICLAYEKFTSPFGQPDKFIAEVEDCLKDLNSFQTARVAYGQIPFNDNSNQPLADKLFKEMHTLADKINGEYSEYHRAVCRLAIADKNDNLGLVFNFGIMNNDSNDSISQLLDPSIVRDYDSMILLDSRTKNNDDPYSERLSPSLSEISYNSIVAVLFPLYLLLHNIPVETQELEALKQEFIAVEETTDFITLIDELYPNTEEDITHQISSDSTVLEASLVGLSLDENSN